MALYLQPPVSTESISLFSPRENHFYVIVVLTSEGGIRRYSLT